MGKAAKWFVGVGCAVFLLALPTAAFGVFQGRNGKIAFVSGRGVGGDASADVYIVDGPGAQVGPPLTTAAGQHRHPNWDGDARRLVYALWNGATQEDIWVHDVELGGRTNITQNGTVRDDRPAFSPDGTKVAYESEVTDGSGQQDILITTIGGGTVNLTSSPNVIEGKPVWSPDGQTIYYSRATTAVPGDHDIYKEPSDNSQIFGEFVINSATAEYQPSLSPGGDEMCYTRGPFGSDAADVYKVDATGFNAPGIDVSANSGMGSTGDYNCAWSPDGTKIIFAKGIFSNGALVHRNSDATGPVELVVNDAPGVFDGNPDWAREPAECQGKPATLYGTDGPDTLVGTAKRDVIVAYMGNDRVRARGGKDIVCAGRGRDTVQGAAGNDLVIGGPGNDRLRGGPGRDTLNGGPGRDTCSGGPGRDRAIKCEVKKNIP
ncbi:MAG TPA: hypothetical protein VK919_11945 [Solirubrobacterales bacterium]|nr:hypothetical protein [Solirubrobacterales bacterium]